MGYDDNPEMVRVDLFKESGKWYTTLALKWEDYETAKMHEYLRQIVLENNNWDTGWHAVCLKPYSKFKHPIMITI